MNIKLIGACSDLGVDVTGSEKGPIRIIKELESLNLDNIIIKKNDIIKSNDEKDLRKNLKYVNIFNKNLFNAVDKIVNDNIFPITIGGDHSIAIGSALGSKNNRNIGIIWVDAHLDYNTFETTITGNLHGLPLAALNGICKPLTDFYNNTYFNPKNTVVVGYRSLESNKEDELANIRNMGVTVFDNDYIKKYGIKQAMEEAIKIANNNTDGMHISYDLDIIDEKYAPGVSVPELDGISKDDAYEVIDVIKKYKEKLKSFDLVEYNPINDIDNITLDIATNIIKEIIDMKKDL